VMPEQRELAIDNRPNPLARTELTSTRVLLAVDDADAAQPGEEWLRRLRWATQPNVDILTVAAGSTAMRGFGLQTYRAAIQEAVSESRETVLLAAQRIANSVGRRVQQSGLPVQTWARHGDIADEIVAMARLESSDLVIVSPHGHSRPLAPWRQAVVEQVLRLSDRAVLVARRPAHERTLPATVLAVLPDTVRAEATLSWLARSGWLDGARVGLAVASDTSSGQARTVARRALDTVELPADVQIHELEDLSAERIIDLTAELGADLVAVSRPRLRHLPDDAAGVVAAAASVLVVPFDRGRDSGAN